ncbi:hypothetical protein NHX12_026403 [Muraenolepis orangiensis]|uniref:Uncharacterized protein n=1 Tax=Muraenolepis orangiensis TaxID=630683 RepID=A0A9Q0EGG3_9TELE|nr:hypothetical protein NHX12_026403 [Muraenolepis orangiensis]
MEISQQWIEVDVDGGDGRRRGSRAPVGGGERLMWTVVMDGGGEAERQWAVERLFHSHYTVGCLCSITH